MRTVLLGACVVLLVWGLSARGAGAREGGGRAHWAFRSVKRPAVPTVKDGAWVRNPIDAFVLARLEARGWGPAPSATPRALLRRMYLDVIGLPPDLGAQEAFLDDASPEGLDRVADRLLADPGYGERWGRHWLDLVRYAETNGYERDAAKPFVWRYRDYVIRAFNEDEPYDRFVLEQLAGDELPGATGETLIATGYYRLGPWDDEPADPQTDRFDQLDDIVSTTAQALLGLTLGCARCHDHKFEPLTARDYYSMVAVFDPLERPRNGRTELALPAGTRAELAAEAERDKRISALRAQIEAQSKLLEAKKTRPAAESAEIAAKRSALEAEVAALRAATPDLPRGYFLHEPSPTPPPTHLLLRGSARQPGAEVRPAVPAVLVDAQPTLPPPGKHTSLRRLTLARWIVGPDNPLTARVIVNRVWQHHFGVGLVRTPSDFGVRGEPPTHPALLDWLAHWFVHDAQWSLKRLHRLILTSNTWRMSKRGDPARQAGDPQNRLLWRVPYRRLEVEAIRDSVLATSGQLVRVMYGPSMYPSVPKAALAGSSDPDKIWKPFDPAQASRRTIYAFIKRSMIVPMLEVLDLCDTTRTAAQRAVTTVSPQALTLFNGEFVNRQARHLADRLVREAGADPARQIDRAFRLVLCRPPTPEELAAMQAFLEREVTQAMNDATADGPALPESEARRAALVQMCRACFNLNEFVYSD